MPRAPKRRRSIALPREDETELDKVLVDLDDEVVSVKVVPDLTHMLSGPYAAMILAERGVSVIRDWLGEGASIIEPLLRD